MISANVEVEVARRKKEREIAAYVTSTLSFPNFPFDTLISLAFPLVVLSHSTPLTFQVAVFGAEHGHLPDHVGAAVLRQRPRDHLQGLPQGHERPPLHPNHFQRPAPGELLGHAHFGGAPTGQQQRLEHHVADLGK